MLEHHQVRSVEIGTKTGLYRATWFVEGNALHIAARGVSPVCIAQRSDRPEDQVRALLGKWIDEGIVTAETSVRH